MLIVLIVLAEAETKCVRHFGGRAFTTFGRLPKLRSLMKNGGDEDVVEQYANSRSAAGSATRRARYAGFSGVPAAERRMKQNREKIDFTQRP